MQTALWLLRSWEHLVVRSFTEHTLGAAILGIAAVGILVLLQQEYRRGHLPTNLLYVFVGWIVSITVLPSAMNAFASGLAALETTTPVVSRISGYLYGIYDRHPLLVLIIVGIGSTGYFLKQSWPFRISWGPVRALCTVLGVVFAVHVAGPIADLFDEEPAAAPGARTIEAPRMPAKEAFGIAVKSGDLRYLSVPQCVEEVAGYPAPASGKPEGVRKLGPSCEDTLGIEGAMRAHAHREYATEYNRLMYEHNGAAESKVSENKQ